MTSSHHAPYVLGYTRTTMGWTESSDGAIPSEPHIFSCQYAWYVLPEYHQVISSRKEVFQPHLPVRLPCYDLAPITSFTLGRPSRSQTSGAPGFHGLTGGVYKARERIHRTVLMCDY